MNTTTTDTLRLFFALWPDDATRTALMQLQAPIKGRIVPYGNLHMTLAFLGRQSTAVITDAKEILSRLSSRQVVLTLDRVGYFPRNRVAWAGMHDAPAELFALQKELVSGLQQHGIGFNGHQTFKPHVTLARDATLPPDIVFEPFNWHANQVALVKSNTLPQGSEYEVIASRSLEEAVRVPDERGSDMRSIADE